MTSLSLDNINYFIYYSHVMNNTYISATDLKRNTAKILNLVAYGATEAIIERYGQPIAKITPAVSLSRSDEIEKKLEKYFGLIPEFPEVSRKRTFRKRKVIL